MAKPNQDLRDQLDRLRKQHQDLLKLRSSQHDAARTLGVPPDPLPPRSSAPTAPHLTLAHPPDVVELRPAGIAKYQRSIQTEPLPAPPPVVIHERPRVHLELDELSKSSFEPVIEGIESDSSQPIVSAYASPRFDQQYISDMHWAGSSRLAVAFRPSQRLATPDGRIRIFDAQRPDKPSEIAVTGMPSVVRWVPRSSDVMLVGTAVGDLFLYDTRAGSKLLSQSVRSGQCHSSQIVSVVFPASTKCLSVASNGRAILWNVDGLQAPLAKVRLTSTASDARPPATVACLDDNGGLIVGFENGTIGRAGAELKSKDLRLEPIAADGHEHGMVTALAFRRTSGEFGGSLAVGTIDGTISLWSRGKCYRHMELLVDAVLALAWQPSRAPKLAICRTGGHGLGIYDVDAGMETPLECPGCPVACDFAADGAVLGVAESLHPNEGFQGSVVRLLRC